ncbi:MAG: hypothetical protein ABGZ35_21005 [Planctomycetaceae bacterium]
MARPQLRISTYCIWLTSFVLGIEAACAAPPADEPLNQLAVLDALVGSWVFRPDAQDGFSARQECKLILNKQFLEIDTHVLRPRHAPASWRALITYDQTGNCYRQWKFSDNGDVSTAHGAWNENTSTLKLSGRSPNGNDSKTSVEIIDGKMMIVSVSEVMSDDKRAVVRFTLGRAPPTEDKQLTK